MNNNIIVLLKSATILLLILTGMFLGFCIPSYVAMKESRGINPKIIDVVNFTAYLIYKIIIKGGKV